MWKFLLILLLVIQEAPKKSTTIVLETPDNLSDVYMKYAQILEDEGYIIRTQVENASIQTSAKEKSFGPMNSGSVYVEFLLKFESDAGKTNVVFTGNYMDFGGAAKSKPIANKGNKNMGIGLAWRLMNELAIRYPGGKLTFIID